MRQKPTIDQSTIVAESRLFRIERLALTFSNGEKREFERLVNRGHGAVLILPILDSETFLLIREYAAGIGDYELAFPKGRVERDEPLLDAANRELMEETGYGARSLKTLKAVTLAPGYLGHKTHLILAEDLYQQSAEGDEPEPIEVVPWRFQDIPALLQREDFTEARSITALYLLEQYRQGHFS